MRIIDWEIRKLLLLVVAVQVAMVGLVGLEALGFDIPILRQIVGFIFLTFIPGILILRILKIHNIGIVESLVYSVGLSVTFVMFSGVFANFILPLIGISQPISALPITVVLAAFTLILGGIAYKRDKEFSASATDCFVEFPRFARDKPHNDSGESRFFWLPYLLLLALPLLAIFGAHLVNLYQNNFLLLFFIIVICCVVALVAFDRLPGSAYPLAIVMIAVSLLLHVTLISSQLSGYDIHIEYYYQNLVAQNGYWNSALPSTVNTCLSILMLCPIYSLLLAMDAVVWVFKIIYPLIFCLVPLALFHTYRDQIGAKKAFFSAFFFMAMMVFFTEMTALARQQIAELFFATLILLMVDRKLAPRQRTTLFIIFALSLIVSHYALGYIGLAFLLLAWAIVALMNSRGGRRAWGWLTHKSGALPQSLTSQGAFPRKTMAMIVCVYLAFTIAWYGGIAQGTALDTIRHIGQSQYSLLSMELMEPGGFFEPTEREALVGTAIGLDFPSASGWGKGFRILQYLTELFIVVGFLRMILRPKGFKFRQEYIALSVVAMVILFACIVIPRFSSFLNVTRFYHICLFLLAPFCILGAEAIWQGASKLFRFAPKLKSRKKTIQSPLREASSIPCHCEPQAKQSHSAEGDKTNSSVYLKFLALVILIPYFLFNSGFILEVTGSQLYGLNDSPSSIALSSYRFDMPLFNGREAAATAYLAQRIDKNTAVYADAYGRLLLYDKFLGQVGVIPSSGEVPENAYVFLRTWNVERQELNILVRHGVQGEIKHMSLSNIPALLEGRQVIYENSGAQIWGPQLRIQSSM